MSEIASICKEILERYVNNNEVTKEDKIYYYLLEARLMKALNISNISIGKQELDLVLDTAIKASKKEKNTSKYLEKGILKSIAWFAEGKVNKLLVKKEERFKLTEDVVKNRTAGEGKIDLEISLSLMNFGKELLTIVKNRDSFSGKRKGYATRILSFLNKKYEVEGMEELFILNLKLKGLELLDDTLESIQEYYKEREGKRYEEIIVLINKRANKAKGRSEIVGCLQTLIVLNEIGELEALDRVDEWKEKNYY